MGDWTIHHEGEMSIAELILREGGGSGFSFAVPCMGGL